MKACQDGMAMWNMGQMRVVKKIYDSLVEGTRGKKVTMKKTGKIH